MSRESGAAPGAGVISPEVVEGVRSREPQALSRFFKAYFPEVFSLAYRLTGDRTAAEDVAQDVFVKVHRAAHRLDPDRNPGPWLATITYNTCRDLWRSRKHREASRAASLEQTPGLADRLPAGGDNPERDILRAEDADRVPQAILRLPEEKGVVILLRNYAGLSHDEIAEAVEATPATVRKRYSRALSDLAGLLKEPQR